jgi:hypothetical protein
MMTYGHTSCHCTWAVCQCYSPLQNAYYFTSTPMGDFWKPAPLPKALSNKQRMESLRLRAYRYIPERVKFKPPSIRPSVQALSMRIR